MVEIIQTSSGWISERCSFNDLRFCRENKCFKHGIQWFYNDKENNLISITKEDISFDNMLLKQFYELFEVDLNCNDFNLDVNSLSMKIDSMITPEVRQRLHDNYHKIIYG